MSSNPEAFEFLRRSAYSYVRQHGKDPQLLRKHCEDALDSWLRDDGAGSDLSNSEARNLVDDVSLWVIKKYKKPKPKAQRRREERQAQVMLAPLLLEYAEEDYCKKTIRNAAKIGGQSKTTVARHLRLQGISPVRDKKIEALPAPIKRLVRILDATFAYEGAWLVRMDHCIARFWDGSDDLPADLPRSTKSTRRKKVTEYLASITSAKIGFNIVVHGGVLAIRRGRRFSGFKDTLAWIEEEERLRGFKLLRNPEINVSKARFWDDPWLSDVVAVLFTGTWRTFSHESQLEPWVRLLRPLLDPRPLNSLIAAAIRHAVQDDFVRDLEGLCTRVTDDEVRGAAYKLISVIETAHHYAQGWEPFDYFNDVDRELRFMKYLAGNAPESYAKLAYFRDKILAQTASEFENDGNPIWATLKRCIELREEERAGTWTAPTSEELSLFRPRAEPERSARTLHKSQ